MYCNKCGKEIENNSVFCNYCGYELSKINKENNKKNSSGEILFTIKPTFNVLAKLFETDQNTRKSIFKIYCFIIIFIIFVFLNIDSLDSIGIIPYFYSIVLIMIILAFAIKIGIDYIQHKNICYNFYDDKIQYIDGFLNSEVKEIKYNAIIEITLRRSFIERCFNLGTICLNTNASTFNRNGIYMHCIKDPNEVYEKIKEITNK